MKYPGLSGEANNRLQVTEPKAGDLVHSSLGDFWKDGGGGGGV